MDNSSLFPTTLSGHYYHVRRWRWDDTFRSKHVGRCTSVWVPICIRGIGHVHSGETFGKIIQCIATIKSMPSMKSGMVHHVANLTSVTASLKTVLLLLVWRASIGRVLRGGRSVALLLISSIASVVILPFVALRKIALLRRGKGSRVINFQRRFELVWTCLMIQHESTRSKKDWKLRTCSSGGCEAFIIQAQTSKSLSYLSRIKKLHDQWPARNHREILILEDRWRQIWSPSSRTADGISAANNKQNFDLQKVVQEPTTWLKQWKDQKNELFEEYQKN